MVKYKLPVGTGPIKKSRPFNTLTDLQKEIYKKVYDPINGILFFAENCCYVNRNGIQHYEPFDYQREMLFNLHNYSSVISLWSRQNGKCFFSKTHLKIKNKTTGEVRNISIEDFFNIIKNQNDKK